MTPTQEGLPASDKLVAKFQMLCDLKGNMAIASVRIPKKELRGILARLATAERQVKELRETSVHVVAAWEALPGPRNCSVREVQAWIVDDIGPAIDGIRAALEAKP